MVIFLNENISNILGFVSLAFICELKNLSDNSEWLTLLFNFFKNIASKDAYFGLLGTIIGAILGSHLTRIAERRRSKNHILQLGWKIRYDLTLTRRELNSCRDKEKRSSYRDHVRGLLSSLIQLDEHFSFAGNVIGRRRLKYFIEKVFSHLNLIVDGYDFTIYDENLLADLGKFLDRFCNDGGNFLFGILRFPRDVIFLYNMRKEF